MQKTMNLRRFAWIAGSLAAAFLIAFLLLHHQLAESRQQENELRVSLTRLEEENKQMNAQLGQVGTEEFIVTSAMTNYAFMNKNDIRFQFTNPEALYAYTDEEMQIWLEEMAE